jgi:hypothetical protein
VPSASSDARDVARDALQGLDPHPEADVDPVAAVHLGQHRAHLRRAPAASGCDERLDQGDLRPALATRGRHLGADEAGPDHEHPGEPGVERDRAPPGRRRGCAACAPPRGARRCPAGPGRGAGGDHQAVERQRPAVGQRPPAGPEVERLGRDARAPTWRRAPRPIRPAAHAVRAPLARRAPAWTAAGGRRARCGSSPTIVTGSPLNPSARRVSAARSPASDAPTTTMRGAGVDALAGLSPRW